MTQQFFFKTETASSSHRRHRFSVDGGVEGVWELGGGVVSPDDALLHFVDAHSALGGQLSAGPVLVQPGHGGEVLLGDGGSVVLHDDGVGVGGITHNQNFDGLFGELFREVMYALA